MKSLIKKISSGTLILLLLGTFFISSDVLADEVIDGFDYSNFYQLDFIQSSGTQYIDTGIISTTSLSFYVDFINLNTTGTNIILGSSGANSYSPLLSSNSIRPVAENKSGNGLGLGYNTRYSVSWSSSNFSINGTTYNYSSDSGNTYGGNILLLHRASGNYFGVAKLYRAKIWDYSLVRDFVPAMRKNDNVVGLYDVVNHKFYTNKGSGSFTYGSIISPISYTVSYSSYENGSVTGYGEYLSGTDCTLTATPNSGYSFTGWSDGSTSNPYTFTVTADKVINPIFTLNQVTQKFSVNLSSNNNNYGLVSGGGEFASGTTIEISAVPNEGYVFTNWSDDNTDNPRSITVNEEINLTANFSPISTVDTFTVNVGVLPINSGWILGGGEFAAGTNINIMAVPEDGYVFSEWSDGVKDNPRNLTVTQDYNLIAKFVKPTYYEFDPFELEEDSLVEYTGSLNHISYSILKRRVIDNTFTILTDVDFKQDPFQSNLHFSGTYFDRTLTGVDVCNGINDRHVYTKVEVEDVIEKLYNWASENLGFISLNDDSVILGFLSDIGIYSEVSRTNYDETLTSTACKLFATDGQTSVYDHLEELGFEKIAIATPNEWGYSETYTYVPGNESINLTVSDLDDFVIDMFNNLSMEFENAYIQEYHYEKDLSFGSSEFGAMPTYGKIQYNVPLWVFGDFINEKAYLTNDSSNIVRFRVKDLGGAIIENQSILKWNGLEKFTVTYETDHYYKLISKTGNLPTDDLTGYMHYNWFTNDQVDSGKLFNKTTSSYGVIELKQRSLYNMSNTSTLGLFNSLGKFLNDWFNRIYLAIGLNGGGSGGDQVIQNVVNNQYNVDIDTNIGDLIHDVNVGVDDFKPMLDNNGLSDGHRNGLTALGSTLLVPVFDLFFDSGLGYMIIIPLVLLLLGLVL